MGSTTLTLPPFGGVVRKLVLANVVVFFALVLLTFASEATEGRVVSYLVLQPSAVAHGMLWQLVTYAFMPMGILNVVLSLLTLWFTGSFLESDRGSKWFAELFYTSTSGGAAIAVLLCLIGYTGHSFLGLNPTDTKMYAAGLWGPLFGILVAFGVLFADMEISLFFVIRMKAKYLVAIYLLVELAFLIRGNDRLSACVQLTCGLCAYLFVRYAPRRGLSFAASEGYFGMRNGYYRWKRRRAARKFEVYMRKQDRVVHFDKDGRYISPEDEKRDPKDKRWMN